ncbi:hypothetical protein BH24GEM3_BH24GEM3_17820 [soil metagenome]
MDAFTVAEEMLGAMTLNAEQLAQLRAINHGYYQRLFTLLSQPNAGAGPGDDAAASTTARADRDLTAAEVAELRRLLEADILDLLTHEQRQALSRRAQAHTPPSG